MTTHIVDKEARAKLNWLQLATRQDKDTEYDYPLRGIHVSENGSEAADGYRLHIIRDLFLYVEEDAETSAIDNGIHILNDGKPISKKQFLVETKKLDGSYVDTQRVLPTTAPVFTFSVNSRFLIEAASMPPSGMNVLSEGGNIIDIEYYESQNGAAPRIMIKTPDKQHAALIMPVQHNIDADMNEVNGLPVNEYELFYDTEAKRTVTITKRRGEDCVRWAIMRDGEALNKVPTNGCYLFECEPLPSSRDDEYFQTHRFATADEAYTFWASHRNMIIATGREWRAFAVKMRQSAAKEE